MGPRIWSQSIARSSLVGGATTGNSNRGHEYGTTLSNADRDALLEYLKTL